MIRAILFDMGGTLDGDGLHWLERFFTLYRQHGVELPRATIRDAFDEAERRASTDDSIVTADLQQMTELHVRWQLAHLGQTNPKLEQQIVAGFIAPVREATTANVRLLADLAERGFTLGVVSNGCGNVERLCVDFGYAPYLSVIVDSRRVRLFKPDPAIFVYAAEKLGRRPEEIVMVGDSFERDVIPAKQIGMKTAWLEGHRSRDCPDPALIDIRLRKLSDLPGALASLTPALA